MVAKKTRKEFIESEATAFLRGCALNGEVNDMTPNEIVDSWMLLDLIEAEIEKKKEEYRKFLMAAAEKEGIATDDSRVVTIAGALVERKARQNKEPDKEPLLSLISQRQLPTDSVYDEIKSLIYNPSKVQYLVETGKLSSEEVNALRKITYALIVKKPKEFTEIFSELKESSKVESPPVFGQRRRSTR